jgi:integrase
VKSREPHIVPLSRQAVAVLQELQPLAGRSKFAFPSIRTPHRPMSDNTVNAGMRRLGYAKEEMG